jgi:hypothetical protein
MTYWIMVKAGGDNDRGDVESQLRELKRRGRDLSWSVGWSGNDEGLQHAAQKSRDVFPIRDRHIPTAPDVKE